MKKALTAIMLAFLLVFAFVGCAEEPAGPPSDSDQPSVTPPDDSDEEEILQLSADYIVLGVGLTSMTEKRLRHLRRFGRHPDPPRLPKAGW